MTQLELRLAIIQLVHVPSRSAEDAIQRAKALEEYILGGSASEKSEVNKSGEEAPKGVQNSEASSAKDKRQQKKSGNVESLL